MKNRDVLTTRSHMFCARRGTDMPMGGCLDLYLDANAHQVEGLPCYECPQGLALRKAFGLQAEAFWPEAKRSRSPFKQPEEVSRAHRVTCLDGILEAASPGWQFTVTDLVHWLQEHEPECYEGEFNSSERAVTTALHSLQRQGKLRVERKRKGDGKITIWTKPGSAVRPIVLPPPDPVRSKIQTRSDHLLGLLRPRPGVRFTAYNMIGWMTHQAFNQLYCGEARVVENSLMVLGLPGVQVEGRNGTDVVFRFAPLP